MKTRIIALLLACLSVLAACGTDGSTVDIRELSPVPSAELGKPGNGEAKVLEEGGISGVPGVTPEGGEAGDTADVPLEADYGTEDMDVSDDPVGLEGLPEYGTSDMMPDLSDETLIIPKAPEGGAAHAEPPASGVSGRRG